MYLLHVVIRLEKETFFKFIIVLEITKMGLSERHKTGRTELLTFSINYIVLTMF